VIVFDMRFMLFHFEVIYQNQASCAAEERYFWSNFKCYAFWQTV